MAELSQQQLDEIVARVTEAVLAEVRRHEGGEGLHLPLQSAASLGSTALWAPWIVALPLEAGVDPDPGASHV